MRFPNCFEQRLLYVRVIYQVNDVWGDHTADPSESRARSEADVSNYRGKLFGSKNVNGTVGRRDRQLADHREAHHEPRCIWKRSWAQLSGGTFSVLTFIKWFVSLTNQQARVEWRATPRPTLTYSRTEWSSFPNGSRWRSGTCTRVFPRARKSGSWHNRYHRGWTRARTARSTCRYLRACKVREIASLWINNWLATGYWRVMAGGTWTVPIEK